MKQIHFKKEGLVIFTDKISSYTSWIPKGPILKDPGYSNETVEGDGITRIRFNMEGGYVHTIKLKENSDLSFIINFINSKNKSPFILEI